jgi:glycosyltransferase involved in cell wall biosynthesis
MMKKEENVNISVIVNIYNIEKYIRKCVDSVLNQDFDSYEIILIDDGSTDNSWDICEEIARNHNNVFSYTKENGGLADARNFGLGRANGEYILYVDGDDYIEENSLSKIWKECERQGKPDIVFLNAVKVYDRGRVEVYDVDFNIENLQGGKEDALEYISKRKMYPAGAWRKLIRRAFLVDNDISFIAGQSAEDYEWSIKTFLNAQSFGCCNERYYYYIHRKGSLSDTPDKKTIETMLSIIEHWVAMSRDSSYSLRTSKSIRRFAAFIYRCVYSISYPYYKDVKKELKKYAFLLECKQTKEIKLIRLCTKCLGLGLTSKLLFLYRGWINR